MAALFSNPLTLLIAQASAIIACSHAVGLFARRIAQPMVIAEITAGILLGPSLFGAVFPAAQAALFPAASLPILHLFSQVGLIFFMFLVGLEVDPKLLKERSRSLLLISASGIAPPFALGALLALVLYPRMSESSVAPESFVLFIGVAMSITAFPVLARILQDRRMLLTKVGSVAMASAAVGDVVSWCILGFVVSVAHVSGTTAALWTLLWVGVFAAAMVFGLRPLLARIFAGTDGAAPGATVTAMLFLLLLGSAGLTELIGVHAVFGAFLLGAIMPRESGYLQRFRTGLKDVTVIFLLPLFFAYSGLRTQMGLLFAADSWGIFLLIVAVACIGKFGGSAVAARATGLDWRDASAIGILMNTRGLVELIVLNIGLDIGVISPLLFTMLVIMALVTTFATTPLLSWVYPQRQLDYDAPLFRGSAKLPADFRIGLR